MIMLNIILTFVGVIYFVFGFLVTFKQKYNLVTMFVKNNKDSAYAEQIGLIALMSGMLYIFTAIIGLVFSSVLFSVLMMAACFTLSAAMFVTSTIRAGRA